MACWQHDAVCDLIPIPQYKLKFSFKEGTIAVIDTSILQVWFIPFKGGKCKIPEITLYMAGKIRTEPVGGFICTRFMDTILQQVYPLEQVREDVKAKTFEDNLIPQVIVHCLSLRDRLYDRWIQNNHRPSLFAVYDKKHAEWSNSPLYPNWWVLNICIQIFELVPDLKYSVVIQVTELMQRTEQDLHKIRKNDAGVRRAHGQRMNFRTVVEGRSMKRLKKQGFLTHSLCSVVLRNQQDLRTENWNWMLWFHVFNLLFVI